MCLTWRCAQCAPSCGERPVILWTPGNADHLQPPTLKTDERPTSAQPCSSRGVTRILPSYPQASTHLSARSIPIHGDRARKLTPGKRPLRACRTPVHGCGATQPLLRHLPHFTRSPHARYNIDICPTYRGYLWRDTITNHPRLHPSTRVGGRDIPNLLITADGYSQVIHRTARWTDHLRTERHAHRTVLP